MATTLAPAINFTNISKGMKSLNTGVGNLKNSSDSIKTVTLNRTKIKKEIFARDKVLTNMREEAVRRKDQESIIEASGIGGAMRRSASVITDSTKGFLGRLLDFASSLLVGWLLYNLPTIMTVIEDLIIRIKSLTGILSDFMFNIKNTFQNFGSLLSGVYQNVTQFDFTDKSKRVQNAMDDLNVNLETMRDQFLQGFDILSKPLGEGPGEKEVPPLNTDYTQPAPTTGGGQDLYTLATIANLESGSAQGQADVAQSIYNRMKKSGKGVVDVTTSPDQYAPFFGKSSKDIDPESKKIKTFDDAVKYRMKKKGENRATAERSILSTISAIQDPSKQAAAKQFVGTRTSFRGSPQNTGNYLRNVTWRGSESDNQFLNEENVSGTPGNIPSFVNSPTKSTTGNIPTTQAPTELSTNFASVTGTSGRSMGSKTLSVPYSPFKRGSGAVITSGKGLRWGKQHTGYDLAAQSGTPLYAYFPGKVTHIGIDGTASSAGYGNWVVWKDDVYGAYHFFGHMRDRPSVGVGQVINQGTLMGYVGSTGVSYGPHLHWEISNSPPASNGQFSSLEDPGAWLRQHPLKMTKSSQTNTTDPPNPSASSSLQAQVSPTTQPGQNVPSIAQDKKGPTVLIVDNPQQSQPQQVSAGGGRSQPQMIPIESSLNSLIKNQILLELAYT
jgi:murein DD-endopeptidase MepM/ murein hydrolase activator NlpD